MTLVLAVATAAAIALTGGGATADPAAAAFDARMAASAGAAERLQGRMDGRWILVGACGRPLFVFEISDPPQHSGPLQAAWRRADGAGTGLVEAIAGDNRRLVLRFAPDAGAARLVLRRPSGGGWRGWLTEANGRRLSVRLRR